MADQLSDAQKLEQLQAKVAHVAEGIAQVGPLLAEHRDWGIREAAKILCEAIDIEHARKWANELKTRADTAESERDHARMAAQAARSSAEFFARDASREMKRAQVAEAENVALRERESTLLLALADYAQELWSHVQSGRPHADVSMWKHDAVRQCIAIVTERLAITP